MSTVLGDADNFRGLDMCRQCFREKSKAMGFVKVSADSSEVQGQMLTIAVQLSYSV